MASDALKQELNCSICLNTYKYPTTLPCGHTFCQTCISRAERNRGCYQAFSCPECSYRLPENFQLNKNTKMCNIVEHMASVQSKPGTMNDCSYCGGTSITLCLLCEVYLCEGHKNTHNKTVEHVLTEVNTNLDTRTCSVHKELLRFYCCEEDVCVCASCCLVGDHVGHTVVTLQEISKNQKVILKNVENLLTAEKRLKKIKLEEVKGYNKESQEKVEKIRIGVTGLFGDIRRELEVLEHKVLCEVSKQEEDVCAQISILIKQLEEEKSKLSAQILDINQLGQSTDPMTVLENCGYTICRANELLMGSKDTTESKAIDEMLIKVALQSGLHDFLTNLSRLQKNRGFHAQDSSLSHIKLELTSMFSQLLISNDISHTSNLLQTLSLDGTPYSSAYQTLSSTAISSGEHYWEVEIKGLLEWGVGMTYRTAEGSKLGFNRDSWCLYLSGTGEYRAVHDCNEMTLPLHPPIRTLGIYLDYEAGVLSFYHLSDTVTLLHTFFATFSGPLHPAYFIDNIGWAHHCSK